MARAFNPFTMPPSMALSSATGSKPFTSPSHTAAPTRPSTPDRARDFSRPPPPRRPPRASPRRRRSANSRSNCATWIRCLRPERAREKSVPESEPQPHARRLRVVGWRRRAAERAGRCSAAQEPTRVPASPRSPPAASRRDRAAAASASASTTARRRRRAAGDHGAVSIATGRDAVGGTSARRRPAGRAGGGATGGMEVPATTSTS